MKKKSDPLKISIEKIIIFEDEENATGGKDTPHEKDSLLSPFRSFDQKSCSVVDGDGQGQNKNVNWDEGHVKDATCHQEKEPAILVGNQEIENGHGGKKD
jgi:hypothetical protein